MSESDDLGSAYPPSVSLVLRGKELDPKRITESLGISAHRSYARGDLRKDGKTWPHGFWMITSSEEINDPDLMVHLHWLKMRIEPVAARLAEILRDKAISAKISCFWIMPSPHEALVFDPDLLGFAAALGIALEIDIYGSD